MTEKLDLYAPTLETVLGIKRQLLRAGIPEDAVPVDWLPAIIAATDKWIATTEDGIRHVADLLGFKVKPGESDKEYTLLDNIHNTQHSIKNTQVRFFEGVLVDGRPVPILDPYLRDFIPPLELEISESSKNQCEGCGIVTHCLKEILEPFSEKLERLCNYCITHHEHPRINDQGGFHVCQECSVHKCQHHPAKGLHTNAG